jgi:hypothetical protein
MWLSWYMIANPSPCTFLNWSQKLSVAINLRAMWHVWCFAGNVHLHWDSLKVLAADTNLDLPLCPAQWTSSPMTSYVQDKVVIIIDYLFSSVKCSHQRASFLISFLTFGPRLCTCRLWPNWLRQHVYYNEFLLPFISYQKCLEEQRIYYQLQQANITSQNILLFLKHDIVIPSYFNSRNSVLKSTYQKMENFVAAIQ